MITCPCSTLNASLTNLCSYKRRCNKFYRKTSQKSHNRISRNIVRPVHQLYSEILQNWHSLQKIPNWSVNIKHCYGQSRHLRLRWALGNVLEYIPRIMHTVCTLFSWWRHQMETFSAFTSHLFWEFTGLRWIPRTKASDPELWCFLWSVSK